MNGYFTALVYPLRPNEAHLFRWADHASVMLNPDGPPANNTPSSTNGHELFEIEEDTLWDVVAKRLQEYDEDDDDDSIEAHLEPIAQATAERFVVAYLAHDALVAYAQAEEASRKLDHVWAREDLDSDQQTALWWELLDTLFPTVGAQCPEPTREWIDDWYGDEAADISPVRARENQHGSESYCDDGSTAGEILEALLTELRTNALALALPKAPEESAS